MLLHLIIHFPSCELLISFSHFSILYFQHQITSIPGSPRIVTLLPLPHSPMWSIIPLYFLHFIHSVSYSPYPTVSPLQPVFFSLCSSVVSLLAFLFISLQFTIPPTPPPVYTLPCPCCNKNSVKLYLCITCTSKVPPVKVHKRERDRKERK